jgi:hypothetical protein
VKVAIDDTVTEHTGRCVYGKACHRDAVRSGKGAPNVKKWGHRWVVLAIVVKLPFCPRPWALPILCALYHKQERSGAAKTTRPCKTPCDLARGLLATLLHWFPDRRFMVIGDGGFASHDLAAMCHRHRDRLTLIARGRSDLRLYALAPVCTPCRQTLWRRRSGRIKNRRCRKGKKLAAPAQTLQAARAGGTPLPQVTLRWYGQSRHTVQLLSGCGGWYGVRDHRRARVSLLPVRWVCVHELQGDRDNWFYSTDPKLSPQRIVELFACRWAIEVTFEEARAHLGLETPRQRCERAVLRTTPCLLGLFSLVSLIFARSLKQGSGRGKKNKKQPRIHQTPCYQKAEPTFADALYAVRRSMWNGCLLEPLLGTRCIETLPRRVKQTLLTYFAEAA